MTQVGGLVALPLLLVRASLEMYFLLMNGLGQWRFTPSVPSLVGLNPPW